MSRFSATFIMNLQQQKETISHTDKKRKSFAIIGALVLVMSIILGVSFASCYEVILDDDTVCYVENHSVLDDAISEAKIVVEQNLGINTAVSSPDIQCNRVIKPFADTIEGSALAEMLAGKASWMVDGALLSVNNGELTYAFLSEAEGQAVLDTLVSEATAGDNQQIISTSFLEEVSLTATSVNLKNVTTTESALASIKAGKEAVKTHVVQEGESFWTIAKKYGISVSSLQKLNPDVSEKRMRIGQELQLTRIQPLISVVVNKIVTVEESIPYGEIVQESSTLLKGEYEVVKQGVNGVKNVTYQVSEASGETLEKVVLEEVVVSEPVAQVIDRGTATVATASRGGDGALNWPVNGKITSSYGYRSSGFHNGLDLGAKYGTTVKAAAGGKVTLAAYSGGYGYCVLIDHGNGIKTRYAHLSKMSVKKGDTVLRGEKIGEIGSTGNSTGPHLHFEVIKNGKTQNPINYLK